MAYLFYILIKTLVLLIGLVNMALFLRAIFSWFITLNDNKFVQIVWTFTEPFLVPMRKLLSKIGVAQGLPIDLSFIATWIVLDIAQVILSSFI